MSLTRLEQAALMIAQSLVQANPSFNKYEIAQRATNIAQEVLTTAGALEDVPLTEGEADDLLFMPDIPEGDAFFDENGEGLFQATSDADSGPGVDLNISTDSMIDEITQSDKDTVFEIKGEVSE